VFFVRTPGQKSVAKAIVANKGCPVIIAPENGVAARKTTITAAIGPMPGTNANIVFHLFS